jgi:N-acetylglucosaminyldiphosphoundecaprenol N-acetyl-beta-D-mannosaminyltransferase
MGARFAAVTESDAASAIVDAAVASRGYWIITANLDHLRRYRSEPMARQLIDEADLIVADGTPLIWASHLAGTPLPHRVAGSNMIWSISKSASHRGASVFLLGGNPGVAEQAAQVLSHRFPSLKIVGTLCPRKGFEKDKRDLDRIRRQVREAAPMIVFVGLPFPKQELLIRRLRQILPHTSFIGVGISFSFVAGEVSRAPKWTHRFGLEWSYRLLQEPRRLVRRYVINGVPFAFVLFASAIRHRLSANKTHDSWGWDTANTSLF